ncbi:ABC transporter permease [Pseudonocardia sp. MH-G8]|uniref:ABC transporter permease n=1 Tax=Pseudonocardia sp. MH-G8 TaxID=1854588 RepID=UPI000BA0D043|nr:ABC transporter permease subunit [Pseudonocardia sp. MH-G8]OZM78063.1 ABC transporter [Pseudonocardia sp. MH-G8]
MTSATRRVPGVAAPRPRPALRRLLEPAVAPLLLLVAFLLVWHVAAVALDSTVFPTPLEAAATLVADLGSSAYLAAVAETLLVLLGSYALAVVIGSLLGFLIGLSTFWSDVLSPLIYAVYSIPKITLYPLFLVFLGLGDVGRIGFAFLHGVIPMLLIVLGATASVDRTHLKLAASLRLTTPQLVRRIVVPSIVPSAVTGLRLAFGLTFLGLLIAELLGGSAGLGGELLRNVQLVRMGNIVGEVILITIIALVPTVLLLRLEHRATARFAGRATDAAPAL